jgi:hypothetical protein
VRSSKIDCEYQDSEISLRFSVQLLKDGSYYGKVALVDWNEGPYHLVRAKYGAWRRLTWFLLDAVLVWLIEEQHTHRSVLLVGGWLNGRWLVKGRFQSSYSDFGKGQTWLKEDVRPYRPYPLDMEAPLWSYEPGLGGAREGKIACVDREGGEVPVADTLIPVAEQLSHVPRFVANDGTILFFHRVVPHSGPEYSPSMDYGVAAADYAFYFSAAHGSPRGKPIRLRTEVEIAQPIVIEERWGSSYQPASFGHLPDRWRLHPALREQQYFAGAEAYALSFDIGTDRFPEMRSIEHDQPMRFGFRLGEISEAPISVGLPSTRLRSWPRLSTETDERVQGFFSKLKEARRARQHREFMDFRERLVRGQVPQREIDDLLARYTKSQPGND